MKLYNVYAYNLETGDKRLIDENKTENNAEAIVRLCVMRRGVDEECFAMEEINNEPKT